MHSPSNGIRILGIVCLLLAVTLPLISQTTTGRILGTVSDQSVAAVAGAAVVGTDVQRGTTRAAASDAAGDYIVPELRPGIFKVPAEGKRFKTVHRVSIVGHSSTSRRIDAIQEFNVEELAPAEFGWKPGAVVNVGLKSGTNSVHGTAFAFGRDGDLFDARNFFNTVPNTKLQRTLEQYGGSVGGAPFQKKSLFFFASPRERLYRRKFFRGHPNPPLDPMPAAA